MKFAMYKGMEGEEGRGRGEWKGRRNLGKEGMKGEKGRC